MHSHNKLLRNINNIHLLNPRKYPNLQSSIIDKPAQQPCRIWIIISGSIGSIAVSDIPGDYICGGVYVETVHEGCGVQAVDLECCGVHVVTKEYVWGLSRGYCHPGWSQSVGLLFAGCQVFMRNCVEI